ncbi:hypothetical protein ACFFX1_05995 [Dactylosporangium sucinum]|uniref:Uncharacterized protein n=1 Tax=Dactylosporangium sucinum TaxID=1424081 RepID=A0A917UG68_9ACTN|nr:hypothetical protein [Dactylosporangium sucinum]GGM85368.1 hypothetical protein GCM10007977_103900 [Dactylosporangium sucinum]
MRRTLAAALAATVSAGLVLAAPGRAALAQPNCNVPVPPPACDGGGPPEPTESPVPEGSDKAPTGRIESHGYSDGTYRISGWARDVNGGPVTVSLWVDQTVFSGFRADRYHAGQAGNVGFDIVVPAPNAAGPHQVGLTLRNVPDGTLPEAPYSVILGILPWTNLPATPRDLALTTTAVGGGNDITVEFTDPSLTEDGFTITYDWLVRKVDREGRWVTTTEARTVHIGPHAGTGRVPHTVTGLPSATYVRFYVRTDEIGLQSPALTGGIGTPA